MTMPAKKRCLQSPSIYISHKTTSQTRNMGLQQDLICTKGPNLALTTAGWRSRLSGLHGSFNAWIATPSTWSPGKIHHPWMPWHHVDVGANKAAWSMSSPPNRSRKHLFMGLTCVIFRPSAISKMNQTHSSLQGQLLRQCPRRSHHPPWHWHLPRYDGIHTRGVPWSKSLEFASIQTRPDEKSMEFSENMMKDRQTNRFWLNWKTDKTHIQFIITRLKNKRNTWIHSKTKQLTAISLQLF